MANLRTNGSEPFRTHLHALAFFACVDDEFRESRHRDAILIVADAADAAVALPAAAELLLTWIEELLDAADPNACTENAEFSLGSAVTAEGLSALVASLVQHQVTLLAPLLVRNNDVGVRTRAGKLLLRLLAVPEAELPFLARDADVDRLVTKGAELTGVKAADADDAAAGAAGAAPVARPLPPLLRACVYFAHRWLRGVLAHEPGRTAAPLHLECLMRVLCDVCMSEPVLLLACATSSQVRLPALPPACPRFTCWLR